MYMTALDIPHSSWNKASVRSSVASGALGRAASEIASSPPPPAAGDRCHCLASPLARRLESWVASEGEAPLLGAVLTEATSTAAALAAAPREAAATAAIGIAASGMQARRPRTHGRGGQGRL